MFLLRMKHLRKGLCDDLASHLISYDPESRQNRLFPLLERKKEHNVNITPPITRPEVMNRERF